MNDVKIKARRYRALFEFQKIWCAKNSEGQRPCNECDFGDGLCKVRGALIDYYGTTNYDKIETYLEKTKNKF